MLLTRWRGAKSSHCYITQQTLLSLTMHAAATEALAMLHILSAQVLSNSAHVREPAVLFRSFATADRAAACGWRAQQVTGVENTARSQALYMVLTVYLWQGCRSQIY